MSAIGYAIKSWFVGQRPFTLSELHSAPLHKIDLFRWNLAFRCPKATYVSEHVRWFQPLFVDTYTKGSVKKPESEHGTKELMTTGWQFRPSIRSDADCIKLRLSVKLECRSQNESEQKLNLLDIDTLVSWVAVSYQEQLAKASLVSMFRGTDGTIALEFNDKDEVKNRIANESSLKGIVRQVEIKNKDFVFFQIGSEMHYYFAISEEDTICFNYSLSNFDSHPLDLDNSDNSERLNKINQFIIYMLETIKLTPSNRLQALLDSKNIQTR